MSHSLKEAVLQIRSAALCIAIVAVLLVLMARGQQWARVGAGLPVGQDRLWDAITQGDVAGVRQAITEGANVNRPHPRQLDFPLEAAITVGDPRVVDELLRRGADPNKACWGDFTPLVRAILTNKVETVKLLLKAGAPVNGSGPRSPLITAIRMKNVEMVSLLLREGADVIKHDATGASPRSVAIESGDEVLIRQFQR